MDNKTQEVKTIRPAKHNGKRIECWKCHSLLGIKINPHGIENFCGETATEFMRHQEPRFVKKVESHENAMEIKCKERRNGGKACDAYNLIQL